MLNSTGACTTLQQLPATQAAIQPDGIALWWHGAKITYSALNQRVLTQAARLASIGAKGDRVAILAWNCPEFVELLYAVPASGRILVPLMPNRACFIPSPMLMFLEKRRLAAAPSIQRKT